MSLNITPSQKDKLRARVCRRALATHIDLPSQQLRLWNGVGLIMLGGESFMGVGPFGSVSGIKSERSISSNGITMTLAGVPGMAAPSDEIQELAATPYQMRPLWLWLVLCDPMTDLPNDDPILLWRGVCDVMSFGLGANYTATLTGEHFSSWLRRTNPLRMTSQSHNARLGNPVRRDSFFDFNQRLNAQPKALT